MSVFRVQVAPLQTADELNAAAPRSSARLAWHASEPVIAVLVTGHDEGNTTTGRMQSSKSVARKSYLQEYRNINTILVEDGAGADLDNINDATTLQQPSCFYIFNCYDQHLRQSFRGSPITVPEIERVSCFAWASTTKLHQIFLGFAHGIVIALLIDVPITTPAQLGTESGDDGKFSPALRFVRCSLPTLSHTSTTGARNLFVSPVSNVLICESADNVAYIWYGEFAGQQPEYKVQLDTNEIFTIQFLFENVAQNSAHYGGFAIIERSNGTIFCVSREGKQRSKFAGETKLNTSNTKSSHVLAAGNFVSESGEARLLVLRATALVQTFSVDKKFKISLVNNLSLQPNLLDAHHVLNTASGMSIQWAGETKSFIIQLTHNELIVWNENELHQQNLAASAFNDYSPTDSIYVVNVHHNGRTITALSLGGYLLVWKMHYVDEEDSKQRTWTYRPAFCGLFAALNFTGVATKNRHESHESNMLIVSHQQLIVNAAVKTNQLLVVRETDALSFVNKHIALIEQVPKRFHMHSLTAGDDDGLLGTIQAEFDVVAVTGWDSTGIVVGTKQIAFFELTTQEIVQTPPEDSQTRSITHNKNFRRRVKTRLVQTLPIEARLFAFNGTHMVAITDKTLHAYADNGVFIDSSTLADAATTIACSANRFYCFTTLPMLLVVEITSKEIVIEHAFELITGIGDCDICLLPQYLAGNNKIAVVLADKSDSFPSAYLPRIATVDVKSGTCAVLHLTAGHSAAAGLHRLGDAEQAAILQHNVRPAAVAWEETASVPILCVQLRPRQPNKNFSLILTAYQEENKDSFIIQASKTLNFDALMVGAKLPFLCFDRKTSTDFLTSDANELNYVPLPLFEGHEQDSSADLLTLAQLHYDVTTGRLEQAMRTLKIIENNEMWTTVAALCLKRPNVELARLCLGNMREALVSSIFAKYERNGANASMLAGLLGVTTGQYQQAFTIFDENHAVSEAEKIAECAPNDVARSPATDFNVNNFDLTSENLGRNIVHEIRRKAQQCQQAYSNTRSALLTQQFDKAVAHANESMLSPQEFVRLIRGENLSRCLTLSSSSNEHSTDAQDAVKRNFAHECELRNETLTLRAYELYQELGDYVSCARIVFMQQQASGDTKNYADFLQKLVQNWSAREQHNPSSAAVLRYLQMIAQMRMTQTACMNTYGMQLNERPMGGSGESDTNCETVFNALQSDGYNSCAFSYALQTNIAANRGSGNRRKSMEQNNAFDDCLTGVGLEASPIDRLELAEHLETASGASTTAGSSGQRSLEQAIGLYRSLNLLDRATRLAFDTGRHDNVELIAETIDEQSSTAVVQKCAQYFIKNQQYERAAQVMAKANQSEAAVELLSKHKVPISQRLVDLLVPPASSATSNAAAQDEGAKTRRNLVMSLAHMCTREGNDALAAKLFSQIGERSEAMRALIKSSSASSSNTEAVVRFAKTARQPDLYVMAANHLQQRLHENPAQYERDIVFMLEKAHELPRLATFFHNCAEQAIDARHGYDKAYGYYQKAAAVLDKMGERASRSLRFSVDEKMKVIAIFNELIKRVKEQPGHVLEHLRKLLNQCGWSEGLRRGDVLVAMAKILYGLENDADGAARLMETLLIEVKQHNLKAQDYVAKDFVQRVFEESGRQLETVMAQAAAVASSTSLKTVKTTAVASTNKDHEHSDVDRANEEESENENRNRYQQEKLAKSAPSEFEVDENIEDEAYDELV